MKNLLLISALALMFVGCAPKEPATTEPATTPAADANAPAPTAQASGTAVAPMASGAAGGMTPMSGTESVQGAGGGSTSMAAKGWAKDKINQTSSSSAGQMPTDEGN